MSMDSALRGSRSWIVWVDASVFDDRVEVSRLWFESRVPKSHFDKFCVVKQSRSVIIGVAGSDPDSNARFQTAPRGELGEAAGAREHS